MSTTVKIRPLQTLMDIAIQEKGTVLAVFEMAVLNGLSITDDLVPGNLIDYDVSIEDIEIKAFFKRNNIYPATALRPIDLSNVKPSGIDYMIIGTNFIVE